MLDAHCHIDLYDKPSEIAQLAERAGVFTIVVTNLPSAWQRSHPHVRQWRNLRLALGLHPLLAEKHEPEREMFRTLLPRTSFVGEVGLDFSREGKATADLQIQSFEFVLDAMGNLPKFVTIHSRGAESQVLEMLRVARRSPVVFHWYTGSLKNLALAVSAGHYFSVNPYMARTESGRKIIAAIPVDRILTETDGPFVKMGKRPAAPPDVLEVERELASLWNLSSEQARNMIAGNFKRLMEPLKGG